PRGLNRELRFSVHQKVGMTLLWSEVLGSFPEGLAPPAGTEVAVPADPGAGELLGCESLRCEESMPLPLVPRHSRGGFDYRDRLSRYGPQCAPAALRNRRRSVWDDRYGCRS